jgi:hypothetical protein
VTCPHETGIDDYVLDALEPNEPLRPQQHAGKRDVRAESLRESDRKICRHFWPPRRRRRTCRRRASRPSFGCGVPPGDRSPRHAGMHCAAG